MTEAHGNKAVLHDGYRFKNRTVIGLCKIVDGLLALLPKKVRALPDPVRKILVIKPDHLGDMLTLTSVLPLIRQKFADATVDVLCHDLSMSILERNPHVSRCLPFVHLLYDRRPMPLALKVANCFLHLPALFRQVHRERYDVCLNFRDSGGDMILLARLAGCRYIVGHSTGGFGPLLDHVVNWQEGRHEVEHYLEVLQPLGVAAPLNQLSYQLYPSAADAAHVDTIVARHGLKRFIIVHPGSGDPRKVVSPELWAAIIAKEGADILVAFTGTSGESSLYDQVSQRVRWEMVNLMGQLTIPQLYLLFCKAEKVFTVDSLSAHLAAMSGTRTIIYWSPWVDENQWRPLGPQVEIVMRPQAH